MLEVRTAHTAELNAATLKAVRVLLNVVFFRHLEAALAIYAAAKDGEEASRARGYMYQPSSLTQVKPTPISLNDSKMTVVRSISPACCASSTRRQFAAA